MYVTTETKPFKYIYSRQPLLLHLHDGNHIALCPETLFSLFRINLPPKYFHCLKIDQKKMCRADYYLHLYCCEHRIKIHCNKVPFAHCRGCGVVGGEMLRRLTVEDFPCDDCQLNLRWVWWQGLWMERSMATWYGWLSQEMDLS